MVGQTVNQTDVWASRRAGGRTDCNTDERVGALRANRLLLAATAAVIAADVSLCVLFSAT